MGSRPCSDINCPRTAYKGKDTTPAKVANCEPGTPLATQLSEAAAESYNSFRQKRAFARLLDAVALGQRALDESRGQIPAHLACLDSLARYVTHVCLINGVSEDWVGELIGIVREAVDITQGDDAVQAKYWAKLGHWLCMRYAKTKVVADLNEGIQAIQEAIRATPEDDAELSSRLAILGRKFHDRYLVTKAPADLNGAMHAIMDSIVKIPSGDPAEHQWYFLATILYDRYCRFKDLASLNRSIEVSFTCVGLLAADSEEKANRLHTLGQRLHIRYLRTNERSDLEEAIKATNKAVSLIPEKGPDWVTYLASYSNQLGCRLEDTAELSDGDRAIRTTQRLVKYTAEDAPKHSAALQLLSALLRVRYTITNSAADLEEAIRLVRRALAMFPKDPSLLYNLANTISVRYQHETRSMKDLGDAIKLGREAMSILPEPSASRPSLLNLMGYLLREKFWRTGADEDYSESSSFYTSAIDHPHASVAEKVGAAIHLLSLAGNDGAWEQAYLDSMFAIRKLPELVPRALHTPSKLHILRQVAGLASDAAAVALHADKPLLWVLHLLEIGRGLLATSIEEMRGEVVELKLRHPELAERFARVVNELEQPVSHDPLDQSHDASRLRVAQVHRRHIAGEELEELREEIRSKALSDDPFVGPDMETILHASDRGPIVIINVSNFRCDAIVLVEHQIRMVELPELDIGQVEARKLQSRDSFEVLEWLWDVIASPVLSSLGFTTLPSGRNWPHLWWIPLGALSKFPIHAAGYHRRGTGETVLDRVISSYSSSVKAILYGRRQAANPTPQGGKALLVAMKDTPGHNRLPFAEKEIAAIHGLCESMSIQPVEAGRRHEDVATHLPQCQIFHYAGHGYSDKQDPLDSHLILEHNDNGFMPPATAPLTVAQLLQMNLRKHAPFLAYLSACGTGQIRDESYADESLHLISALQLAGFRHAVGSLWNVDDETCVQMAKLTYGGMKDEGMTDESVSLGLHMAVREFRRRWITPMDSSNTVEQGSQEWDVVSNRELRDGIRRGKERQTHPLYWVPYVHFGAW